MPFLGIVAFMHAQHQLSKPLVGITATHVEVLQILVKFATSNYSVVRSEAQKILNISFALWPYSYKLIMPSVLKIIKNFKDHTHEQFKVDFC